MAGLDLSKFEKFSAKNAAAPTPAVDPSFAPDPSNPATATLPRSEPPRRTPNHFAAVHEALANTTWGQGQIVGQKQLQDFRERREMPTNPVHLHPDAKRQAAFAATQALERQFEAGLIDRKIAVKVNAYDRIIYEAQRVDPGVDLERVADAMREQLSDGVQTVTDLKRFEQRYPGDAVPSQPPYIGIGNRYSANILAPQSLGAGSSPAQEFGSAQARELMQQIQSMPAHERNLIRIDEGQRVAHLKGELLTIRAATGPGHEQEVQKLERRIKEAAMLERILTAPQEAERLLNPAAITGPERGVSGESIAEDAYALSRLATANRLPPNTVEQLSLSILSNAAQLNYQNSMALGRMVLGNESKFDPSVAKIVQLGKEFRLNDELFRRFEEVRKADANAPQTVLARRQLAQELRDLSDGKRHSFSRWEGMSRTFTVGRPDLESRLDAFMKFEKESATAGRGLAAQLPRVKAGLETEAMPLFRAFETVRNFPPESRETREAQAELARRLGNLTETDRAAMHDQVNRQWRIFLKQPNSAEIKANNLDMTYNNQAARLERFGSFLQFLEDPTQTIPPSSVREANNLVKLFSTLNHERVGFDDPATVPLVNELSRIAARGELHAALKTHSDLKWGDPKSAPPHSAELRKLLYELNAEMSAEEIVNLLDRHRRPQGRTVQSAARVRQQDAPADMTMYGPTLA